MKNGSCLPLSRVSAVLLSENIPGRPGNPNAQTLCEAAHDHPDSERGEQSAREPAALHAERCDLFEQHEDCQRGDAPKIHYAADEKQQHQRPAATEAVEAVRGTKMPGRQWRTRNSAGERQALRHVRFHGVS
jgi:hypothetical protein